MGPHNKCRKGEMCENLVSGNCLYYHPPTHVHRDALYNSRTVDRMDLMRKGLKYRENIRLQSLDIGDGTPVKIEDVRHISSFNKTANNQIAVPGM